jgi:hypothetical protein
MNICILVNATSRNISFMKCYKMKYDSLGYVGKNHLTKSLLCPHLAPQGLKSEGENPKSNKEIMVQETNTLNSILNLV